MENKKSLFLQFYFEKVKTKEQKIQGFFTLPVFSLSVPEVKQVTSKNKFTFHV